MYNEPMLRDNALKGKTIIVTGGGTGLGKSMTRYFLQLGANAVITSRRIEVLEQTAKELEAETGGKVLAVACDVRDDDSVRALIDTIVQRHGRLDVVVNNAGGSPYVNAAEATANFSRKIIELNLIGPLQVAQHANAVMQEQATGGSIVNISSVSGRRPTPGTAAYGAAKAGLENLTATLAVEWAPKVRVNSVVVGMVETEQSELFYGDADSVAAISKNVPLGRLAKPADIGWATAFLASDAASYISGASLEVHGGGEPPHYLATTTANIK